jgi:hypothetical protein
LPSLRMTTTARRFVIEDCDDYDRSRVSQRPESTALRRHRPMGPRRHQQQPRRPRVLRPTPRCRRGPRRAKAYLDAGGDCVYPIALREEDALRAFLSEVDSPVNVVRLPTGTPPLAELAALGVARVSWGPFLFRSAMARFDGSSPRCRDERRFRSREGNARRSDARQLGRSVSCPGQAGRRRCRGACRWPGRFR